MKPLSSLIMLVLAGSAHVSLAQETGPWSAPSAASLSVVNVADPDKVLQSEMDQSRKKLELILKTYLVAFDSRHDRVRKRVGLPLASFLNGQGSIAYDFAGQNVMAQWRLSSSNLMGKKLNYHAYLGESGAIQFVIRTDF